MYTVSFYSYRGGVGRTTALANVAMDLAVRKRKVLLIDFDLEAPSLPSFVRVRAEDKTHVGVVEFIDEYLRSGKAPDVKNYVYQTAPLGENCGEVWVMPAGRGDDNYWRAFQRIDWKELYGLKEGFILFEDMKFQIQEWLHPHCVLVNARAGINDRLAICTHHLPDAIVLVFAVDSNGDVRAGEIAGIQQVLTDITTEPRLPGAGRTDLIFAASKVTDFIPDLGVIGASIPELRRRAFRPLVAIPDAPESLLGPPYIPSLCPRTWLARAYRDLADAVVHSLCMARRIPEPSQKKRRQPTIADTGVGQEDTSQEGKPQNFAGAWLYIAAADIEVVEPGTVDLVDKVIHFALQEVLDFYGGDREVEPVAEVLATANAWDESKADDEELMRGEEDLPKGSR